MGRPAASTTTPVTGTPENARRDAEKACDEVLAIPIFAGLGEERLRRVAQTIIDFLR